MALTCHTKLSQLSEMYAPHSPGKAGLNSETETNSPLSFPHPNPPSSAFTVPNYERATLIRAWLLPEAPPIPYTEEVGIEEVLPDLFWFNFRQCTRHLWRE